VLIQGLFYYWGSGRGSKFLAQSDQHSEIYLAAGILAKFAVAHQIPSAQWRSNLPVIDIKARIVETCVAAAHILIEWALVTYDLGA
jgi:hypothetical protein